MGGPWGQKICSVSGLPDVDWEELEMLKALVDRQYRAVLSRLRFSGEDYLPTTIVKGGLGSWSKVFIPYHPSNH